MNTTLTPETPLKSEFLSIQITATEIKLQEFVHQLPTARRELEKARDQIDFSQPKTVTAATNAQAKFSVIEQAQAELERRLEEMREEQVEALAQEAHAAKMERIRELAAAAIANRIEHNKVRQDAAKQIAEIRQALSGFAPTLTAYREEFASLVDGEGPAILAELEEMGDLRLLRYQENDRYSRRFWEVDFTDDLKPEPTPVDDLLHRLFPIPKQHIPDLHTVRFDERTLPEPFPAFQAMDRASKGA